MAKRSVPFQTIRTEGAILPPDILRRIASLKVDGATPDAYHLAPGSKLNEAISQSWTSLLHHWQAFQEARERLTETDETGTAVTNERWLLPLFNELDYGRLVTTKAPEIDERVYPIERFYNHTPIHLIGCRLPLDRRTKGARGAATASPHSMVQEYLNRSNEHVWAFLSNGLLLRILRDNVSLSRQAFVEFDVEAMMEGEVYADFALLWLLCHQSRVESEKPEDCWLEKWSHLAREEGTRVLKDLRVGVAKAIEALGRGFLGHPRNDQLREKLHAGTLSKDDFYRQLLRIVYRLLFLFVAEDRELLHPSDSRDGTRNLYDTHYSTRRLRDLALKMRGSKHADLWHSLSLVFAALGKNGGCPQLALCGLGSFLWQASSTADLNGPVPNSQVGSSDGSSSISLLPTDYCLITNDDLLQAIRELAYVEQDRVIRMVDYRNLGSEELGSVYEALLELHPVMNVEAKSFELLTAAGNERKITGSYYTPDSLVQCLLDSALDPVVEERLTEAKELASSQSRVGKNEERELPDWFALIPNDERNTLLATGYSLLAERALLALKVCDPACGSGHFLIAAAHRLARHLARVRTGESEPSPEDYQHALRDVIGRCMYGVDVNPMAVELCKVSLWMEAIEPGKPLSFLDHHIQCGNSLLGTTPALLARGIPDDAFKPIDGDDKTACNQLKRENKRQREEYESGQGYLFAPLFKLGNLPATISQVNLADDESLEHVAAKQEMYAAMVKGADYLNARLLADLWCAAFVWKKDKSDLGQLCPTERYFRNVENNPHSILPHVKSEVRRLADQYQFFHWHLAFPDVFRLPGEGKAENEQTGWNAGFDVILGNPPWEHTELKEKEWFATRFPDIATASTGAKRKSLIKGLATTAPELFREYQGEKRTHDGTSQLVRFSGVYPLCGMGRINTYAIFAEAALHLIGTHGRYGLILPVALVTSETLQHFFRFLMNSSRLASFLGFDNEEKRLFPDIDNNLTFAAVTVAGDEVPAAEFCFNLRRFEQISERERYFALSSEDLALLNPNTQTCPIFRSQQDAALTKYVYQRFPVLVRELAPTDDPWDLNVRQGLFNMTSDSALFIEGEELASRGAVRSGNNFMLDDELYVPLYEAKMFWHFEHRWASYYGREMTDGRESRKYVGWYAVDYSDPSDLAAGRYWVRRVDTQHRFDARHNFMIVFRNVTNMDLERTSVFAILPAVGIGNSAPVISSDSATPSQMCCFLADRDSFISDFIARKKIGGSNLSQFVFRQLPTIPPRSYARTTPWKVDESTLNWVGQRVLELTYTAWDLEAFALDCGYAGPPFRWDEERRFLLRCELDAAYFHLYLGPPAEWGSDSPQLREMFPTPRDAVDYIMETFPIVRRKDIARTQVKNDAGEVIQEGHYVTKDTILDIYDEMAEATRTGHPYQTRLNPPPGPPTDAEGNFIPTNKWDPENWPCHIHPPRPAEVRGIQ